MVKHNNVVPNAHFHKDWQSYVKTWFDQPARKLRKQKARSLKLAMSAPNPLETLRPIVQAQTVKYSANEKKGRGFSIEELKKAGLTAQFAKSIGIKVDHRRSNKSAETLQKNVQRLELFKSKLTLYPLKSGQPKHGQVNDAVIA